MNSHQLAELLLSKPSTEVYASLDVVTDDLDKYGDIVMTKVFGSGLIDVISANSITTLHFEESS